MPSLKEYKNKLNSFRNTRKVARTMKMVAMSKLTKAISAQRKASLFSSRLHDMISRLMGSVESKSHPLFEVRNPVKRTLYLIISSDRGMCGGFNNNLIRFAAAHFSSLRGKKHDFKLSYFGRKGYIALGKKIASGKYYGGDTAQPLFNNAIKMAADFSSEFMDGKLDEAYMIYNNFISPISQKPLLQKLLPVDEKKISLSETCFNPNFIFEPSQRDLLSILAPKIVEFEIYYALLVNAAGENSARVTAMDSATKNADKMINHYTMLRNRARQAAITRELIEIISGAEGLKGISKN